MAHIFVFYLTYDFILFSYLFFYPHFLLIYHYYYFTIIFIL